MVLKTVMSYRGAGINIRPKKHSEVCMLKKKLVIRSERQKTSKRSFKVQAGPVDFSKISKDLF